MVTSEIVNKNGEVDLRLIQMEVDAQREVTGKFRKKKTSVERPGKMHKPKGDWPENWLDTVHEFDGHGIGADPLDRTGEGILDAHVSSLYAQHGVKYVSDDVSGADLDPKLVKAGRAVEMGFFENMVVYDRVPRAEQKETRGKVIGTKWIDTNKGDIDNPKIRSRLGQRVPHWA